VSVAKRAAREQRIANATAVVERCRKCAIGSIRKNSFYGEGDPCANVMVVGEVSGETEDKLGRSFVG
jgi:uracil-DNA glycosylase